MINNKKLANGVNDNEQSKKVSWWINELDSLGIEKSSSRIIIKVNQKIVKNLRTLLMI